MSLLGGHGDAAVIQLSWARALQAALNGLQALVRWLLQPGRVRSGLVSSLALVDVSREELLQKEPLPRVRHLVNLGGVQGLASQENNIQCLGTEPASHLWTFKMKRFCRFKTTFPFSK